MIANIKGILSCVSVVLMVTLVWAFAWLQACEQKARFYRTPSSLQYNFQAADADVMPAVAGLESQGLIDQ